LPLLIDPEVEIKGFLKPDVLIDAILAKKNLGTTITDARLVVGLGPGFCAGEDVHRVVETNRGHNLGRIIADGEAAPNTGVLQSHCRLYRTRSCMSPKAGRFETLRKIGEEVKAT
jgi:xanthine dehydrogenase accessory factor